MNRRRLLTSMTAAAASPWPSALRAQVATPPLTEDYVPGPPRLFLIRSGAGKLMLFLHGFPDTGALYEPQIAEFRSDFLVAAPNLRGIPPSDIPSDISSYSMPRLLEDVHAVLNHLRQQRCILVGNDWGGYVAWVFASAYPDRVERLVILNAPHPAIHAREIRRNADQIQASQYERAFHDAVPPYPAWYNYYRADPIKAPASLDDATRMSAPDLAADFFRDVAYPPVTRSLRVEVPTLVIWGLTDPYTLPGQLDGLEAYAARPTVIRIPDAGHYPMQSHPQLVNQSIRTFLA